MPQVSYVGVGALKNMARTAMVEAVNQGGEHFIGVAMGETPVDEGTLRASITRDPTVVTGSSAKTKVHTGGEASEYAELVHGGTGPHEIRAAPGSALNIPGVGPRASVQHPGTAANPYMERAAIRFGPAFKAFVAAAMSKAF